MTGASFVLGHSVASGGHARGRARGNILTKEAVMPNTSNVVWIVVGILAVIALLIYILPRLM